MAVILPVEGEVNMKESALLKHTGQHQPVHSQLSDLDVKSNSNALINCLYSVS
jgi:hypothetical protein